MLKTINNQRFRVAIFMVFLGVVNLVLRFYKLAQTGLWSSDEVAYYMICQDAIGSFQKAVFSASGALPKLCGFFQTLQLLTGYPPKFGFYVFNSIALALYNRHSTMLFISAIFSMLTILVVFLIGNKFFNFRIGIISSVLFSFSLIYLRYSRNGFSMGLTYFFLVLSVYYYLDFTGSLRLKSLILSGFILGVSLFCHSQVILFLLVMLFVEFLSCLFIYRKDLGEFLKRITVFISAFFVPLAILEVTINIGRIFNCFSADSYFRQILNTFTGNTAVHQKGLIYPFYYLDLLWNLESPFIFILVILCLPLIIKRLFSQAKSAQPAFLVSALFILPYLYWVLQRHLHQVDYNCLGAWPFLFLYIAIGFDTLFQKIKFRFLRISSITLFIMIASSYSIFHVRTLFEIKSHFPQVSQILKKYNIKKLISYNTGGIYGYSYIDPYLQTVEIYTADNVKDVYKIAREKDVEYCFYGSWEYFLANTKDSLMEGELVERIKDTTIRPHFPLLFYTLMNNGIQNTQYGLEFKASRYDYMYLYRIRLKRT